ncbi:F0F1 ATP synthase subunit B [bacterium]|nr:F0F1 ATP synthase subunit B [bacterium]MBU1073720.1 F0F1 ATP synthase subunit B [bacterium]MBU1676847.1 F0F1 ATP synthase subunit B [bacterium]
MELNIPVVLTNIAGFVIVVWILAKFAWGPILDLLDARRDKISSDFAEAEQARGDAEKLRGDFESKLGEIKVIEREKVQEAVVRGEEIADRIKGEAQAKAGSALDKARQDIEVETQKAQLSLRDDIVELALGSAEKLINQKLDDETHRRLIREYIDSLGKMPHA